MKAQSGQLKPIEPFFGVRVLALATISFLAHLLVAGQYGYFRDELYYIAAGRHLAPGYVDFPAMLGLLAALLDRIAGDSLIAIHVVPALANAALVLTTGLIARELGGGRRAQGLAALATLVNVVFLATGSIFSMDILDALWWSLGALIVARLLRTGQSRLWLLFGLVAGLGLLTKLTILFFGFGVIAGLLLTPERGRLASRWLWVGGGIAMAFLLPYLGWNATHGWPTLSFWSHYGGHSGGPLDFLINQIVDSNLFGVPMAISGLLFFFRSKSGRPFRALGWTFALLYVLFTVLASKPYFLTPAYPILYAGGACLLTSWARRPGRRRVLSAYAGTLVLSGILLAPLAMPVLPPATFARTYGALSSLGNGGAGQSGSSVFPQYLGDRFGWPELTTTVAHVADSLPTAERSQACIFTVNYGEASALEFLGGDRLPPVISGHNNFFYWGPGRCNGSVLITVGIPASDAARSFGQVTLAATFTCTYCMPDENNLPILICRQPNLPIPELWTNARHFD